MKDYRLDRKAEPNYILGVTRKDHEVVDEAGKPISTLHVRFADGRTFKKLVCNEENVAKVIKQQEEQAKKGVENISVFEKRKTKAGIMTGAAIIGGPLIASAADSLVNVATQTESNPVSLCISAGVITLATLVPGIYSLIKNSSKVKELKKIKFRNDNREQLQTFPQYENALVGLPKRKQRWFENVVDNESDPFCITEIDEYTENDLRQIMKNMDTEKTYQFAYTAKPNHAIKK